ncbi:hypothetical protein PQX77_002889 [Marasmius sp. AFHP31]|nr:hypothetical protein PQX77_002889 [Marasmius sp. AFHP31]
MEILYYNLRDFEEVGFAELLTAVQVCKAVKKPAFLLPHPIGPGEGSVLGESREAVPLLRGESIVNEFVQEEEYGLVDDDKGITDIESGRDSSTFSELSSYASSRYGSDDFYQNQDLLPDSVVEPATIHEDAFMADSGMTHDEDSSMQAPPSSVLLQPAITPSDPQSTLLTDPAAPAERVLPTAPNFDSLVPLDRFQQERLGRVGAVEELQRARLRIAALEGEMNALQAQNVELREGMHRSQEVEGTNVNQNLSRFLSYNDVTIAPEDIPTLIAIAERGAHAPAGQILGAVAAMTEDHHSRLLCLQAEHTDSSPEISNMLHSMVHEGSGMSNFVRSAVSSFNSVSNMTDRRHDYDFVHDRGSRGRHALLRMREDNLRWSASMAARTEGWVQLDALTKSLGKRREPEDGKDDGAGPSKR